MSPEENPEIGVMVSYYSAPAMLPCRLESTRNQTYGSLVIIFIGDGCACKGASICKLFNRELIEKGVLVNRLRPGAAA